MASVGETQPSLYDLVMGISQAFAVDDVPLVGGKKVPSSPVIVRRVVASKHGRDAACAPSIFDDATGLPCVSSDPAPGIASPEASASEPEDAEDPLVPALQPSRAAPVALFVEDVFMPLEVAEPPSPPSPTGVAAESEPTRPKRKQSPRVRSPGRGRARSARHRKRRLDVQDVEPAAKAPRLGGRKPGAPASRRYNHNISERQRRMDLKTSFTNLRVELPALRDKTRAHTNEILQCAYTVICNLREEEARLVSAKRQLQRDNDRLRAALVG